MVLDYSERRPVSKNRPKKQPISIWIFVVTGAVIVSFGAGFIGGWFFGGRSAKKGFEKATAAKAAVPAVSEPQAKPAPQDVPLTFYQTLPSGAKAVIGSGLNPAKTGDDQKKAKPIPAEPQEQKAIAPAPAVQEPKPQVQPPAKMAAQPPTSTDGTFCVQVASLKDRKEAEAIRSAMLAKGQAAYVVESNVPDKGMWYRVRVGKHLKHQQAGELAAKTGKGAIVIAE